MPCIYVLTNGRYKGEKCGEETLLYKSDYCKEHLILLGKRKSVLLTREEKIIYESLKDVK